MSGPSASMRSASQPAAVAAASASDRLRQRPAVGDRRLDLRERQQVLGVVGRDHLVDVDAPGHRERTDGRAVIAVLQRDDLPASAVAAREVVLAADAHRELVGLGATRREHRPRHALGRERGQPPRELLLAVGRGPGVVDVRQPTGLLAHDPGDVLPALSEAGGPGHAAGQVEIALAGRVPHLAAVAADEDRVRVTWSPMEDARSGRVAVTTLDLLRSWT